MAFSPFEITVEIPRTDLVGLSQTDENHPAVRRWIDTAAEAGFTATFEKAPHECFVDGTGGFLLALVNVAGDKIVLTQSNPYGFTGDTHTIAAREPSAHDLNCFSGTL